MSYIGQAPAYGRFRKLDDVSASFDGVTTSFAITVGGTAFIPSNALQLLVVLNGVVKEPGVHYSVNGSNLVFVTAPTGGWTLHAILFGDVGFLPTAGLADYVAQAAQPNITSVGTLTSLSVNGTITGTRLISNITTGTAPLTVTSTTQVANLNVATAGSATTAGTVTTAAQPNITSVGTLSSLGVSGAVTASTLVSNVTTGTAPLTVTSTTQVANLNVATAGSATTAGTVTTAAQPNITSVGTLTSLTMGASGITFSDSSVQTKAGASTGKAIAMAIVFG